MKYWISLVGALILTLFTTTALAFSPPPAPTLGYVVDQAGKLSASDIAALNAKIENVKTSTSNEIGILIVQSLGGENIEDVTHATFKEWKVGKAGLDNGVLVVWAPAERKVRIQTGKGVEGDLTDLQANDIIGKMKPYLRSGDGAGALGLAVDQIGGTIESRRGNPQVLSGAEAGTQAVEQPQTANASGLGWLLLGIPLIGGVLFAFFLMFRNKKEEELSYRSTYTPPAPVTKPSVVTPSYSTSPSYTRSYTPSPVPSYTPSVSKPKKKSSSSSSSSSSYSSSSSSSSYSSGGSSWDSGGSSGGFGGGDSGGGGASGDY